MAFNLLLAVQSCLDVASHVIADEGWPPATTIASAFVSLHDQGFRAEVAGWVRTRVEK